MLGPVVNVGDTIDVMSAEFDTGQPLDEYFGIDEYVLGRVYPDGSLVGYPPLHAHGLHLNSVDSYNPAPQFGNDMPVPSFAMAYMDNHGDSQCSEGEGGVSCLAHRAPAGHANFVKGLLNIQAKIYDVRPAGSAPLTTWQIAAVHVTPRQVEALQIHRYLLSIVPWFHMQITRGHRAVVWTAGTFGGAGLDLKGDTYWHSHPGELKDVYLYQGTPEEVFASLSDVRDAYENPVYGEAAVARVADSVRRLQRIKPVPYCSYREELTADASKDAATPPTGGWPAGATSLITPNYPCRSSRPVFHGATYGDPDTPRHPARAQPQPGASSYIPIRGWDASGDK